MNNKILFDTFQLNVAKVYGHREAASIVRIVCEDVFGLRIEAPLSEKDKSTLQKIENQLLKGVPLQYIIGVADFYGMKIKVNRKVLIPRQDTETLVYEVIRFAQARKTTQRLKILDIGTGSGCIALALKKELDDTDILAVDVSISALNIARRNNKANGLCVQFEQMDILDEQSWDRMGTYDIIVSNPPYIPPSERSEMPSWVKYMEPELALFVPEDDALVFYRKIGLFAQAHLTVNGMLAVEVNEFRAGNTQALLVEMGFQKVTIIQDLGGADRVVMATKG